MNRYRLVKQYLPEITATITCLALGMLSGYLSHAHSSRWYHELNKPFFNPPDWVFAPVWTILYIMMGIAFGMIIKNSRTTYTTVWLFVTQFFLNLSWSPLFFYAHRIDLATIDVMLLVIILWTLLAILKKTARTAWLLMLPYTCWSSFALLMTLAIYSMNH